MQSPIESLDVIRENMHKHKKGDIQVQVAASFPKSFPEPGSYTQFRAIVTVYAEDSRDILEVEAGRIYSGSEVAFDGTHFALPFETSKPHLFLLGCANQCLDTLRQLAKDDGEAFEMPASIIEDIDLSNLPILEALEGK